MTLFYYFNDTGRVVRIGCPIYKIGTHWITSSVKRFQKVIKAAETGYFDEFNRFFVAFLVLRVFFVNTSKTY